MSRRRPIFTPEPRTWNLFQVACSFGRGEDWFKQHQAQLEAEGFPQFDELLGGWDAKAIDDWRDRRSGLYGPKLPSANPWEATNGKH